VIIVRKRVLVLIMVLVIGLLPVSVSQAATVYPIDFTELYLQYSSMLRGYVDLHVAVKNLQSKEIKYVRFKATPYNTVDDVLDDSKTFRYTGPLKKGESESVYWERTFLTRGSLGHVTIDVIEVEYMDGTKETFSPRWQTNKSIHDYDYDY
jgi:hypothetical protein